MNRLRFLAVLATLSVAAFGQQPSPRHPESLITFHGGSGSELLQQCEAALKIGAGPKTLNIADMQAAVDGSFCRAYVLGVADTMIAMNVSTTKRSCIPADVDTDQLIRVTVKYLNDNPAKLHYPSGALVFRALTDAFLCKGQ